MGRNVVPIILDETVRSELEFRRRSQASEHREVNRAAVILLWSQGKTVDETCAKLGIGATAVHKWRSRFRANGMAGLADEFRSGRPRRVDEAQRMRIVESACSKPKDGSSHLSQRRIAKAVGVSQSLVRDVLAQKGLRPHKTAYWCGKSTDPEFEPKMLDIVGLYLSPPENALVLCVDEKTNIQALDRSQAELPMRKDEPRRLTATYKRNGTASLIAALSVHDGKVSARTMDRNDGANFLGFLKALKRAHPRKHLHIIADNLAAHKTPEVRAWLAKSRTVTIHYTPTYSSWLNQVEIFFGILTRDVLKDAVWKSKEQLVKELMRYVRTYSKERAHPFNWKGRSEGTE